MAVEVDGSLLEGGGQILRVATALAATLRKPLKVFNIRSKRSPPGLRLQHVTAVNAVAKLVDADVRGLQVGSSEISFIPGTPKGGEFFFDIGSAGSVTLALQALMPSAAFAPSSVSTEIRGGTNNLWAPPVEYLQEALLPALQKMGLKSAVTLLKRGFYPQGGGSVKALVEPVKRLKPVRLVEAGGVVGIRGLSYSSRLPSHIVERMARTAKDILRNAGYEKIDIALEALQPPHTKCAVDPGCGIILFADLERGGVIVGDSLGELGKPAEKVGREAVECLLKQLETRAPVDRHLGDQLIVWLCLAEGVSTIRVCELTLHTLTCIKISELLAGAKFDVQGKMGESATITCHGIGLKNPFI
jgi:RNA 3'-terminal phosphate cyclase (ATP)